LTCDFAGKFGGHVARASGGTLSIIAEAHIILTTRTAAGDVLNIPAAPSTETATKLSPLRTISGAEIPH